MIDTKRVQRAVEALGKAAKVYKGLIALNQKYMIELSKAAKPVAKQLQRFPMSRRSSADTAKKRLQADVVETAK